MLLVALTLPFSLLGGVIGEDTLWACTTCGYCEAACPIELEHLDRFFAMRQHQVPELVAALNEAGYTGYCSVEFEGKENADTAVPKSIELLRKTIGA